MVIHLDENLENADWIKKGSFPFESKEELLEFLNNTGTLIEDFKKLPVYYWHKDKISWLKDL